MYYLFDLCMSLYVALTAYPHGRFLIFKYYLSCLVATCLKLRRNGELFTCSHVLTIDIIKVQFFRHRSLILGHGMFTFGKKSGKLKTHDIAID